jgi:hypothetical protein
MLIVEYEKVVVMKSLEMTLAVGSYNDNLNTRQTME